MTSDTVLRLGTWNCNRAFARKQGLVPPDLDLCVVILCSEVDFRASTPPGSVWFGDSKKKGVGVYSPAGTYHLMPVVDALTYRVVAPFEANGPVPLTLIAIWSFNRRQPVPRPLEAALASDFIECFDGSRPVVLLGDFNNNTFWDTPRRPHFRQLSDWLTARGLESAYHAYTGETNGSESRPTHWSYGDETKPHHIDYAFLPASWDVVDLSVGDHASWAQHSDHALLTVEVRVPGVGRRLPTAKRRVHRTS